MDAIEHTHLITDAAALEALYGEPSPAAVLKEVNHVHPHYRAFIQAAPFITMATSGPGGLDVTPRGDPAGFVEVVGRNHPAHPRPPRQQPRRQPAQSHPRSARRPAVPHPRRRRDAARQRPCRNLHRPDLLARFPAQGKLPRSVIVVRVESVYFQCPKAIVRSDLWNPDKRIPRSALPSTGTILADLTRGQVGGADYDKAYPQRLKETIY